MTEKEEQRTANSTYPKVAVQWLNQALYIYQSLCLVDSDVLRNRQQKHTAKPLAFIGEIPDTALSHKKKDK